MQLSNDADESTRAVKMPTDQSPSPNVSLSAYILNGLNISVLFHVIGVRKYSIF